MASNDPVLLINKVVPPQANAATADSITGASTPAETFPVFDFDAATVEYMDYHGQMSHSYDGGGLTVRIAWSASSAATGNVIWSAAIRRIVDDTEDLDTTAHTYAYNDAAADAAPTVIGEVTYTERTFTDGADIDSLAAGERFVLRVRRFASDGSDTMSGDAEVHGVSGRES